MSPVRAEKNCETLSSKLSDMPNKPSWNLKTGLDPLAFGEDRRAAAGWTGLTFRCAYFPVQESCGCPLCPSVSEEPLVNGFWGLGLRVRAVLGFRSMKLGMDQCVCFCGLDSLLCCAVLSRVNSDGIDACLHQSLLIMGIMWK